MEKVNGTIDVETYACIDTSGISVTTYVGQQDEAVCDRIIKWNDLINQEFDLYTMPSFDEDVFTKYDETSEIDFHAKKHLYDLAVGLRVASEMIEDRLNAAKTFDRAAWIAAGGKYQDIKKYLL